MEDSISQLSILKAVSNDKRLKILKELKHKQSANVTEISEWLQISIPACSEHLKQMEDANVLVAKRRGMNVIYRLPLKIDPISQLVIANL
ncbi:winged helix-turn-helix transcriptional regulator [Candidatus Peregrinibacteria bacterium]|jgi:DNA-binding transcriptional ArsR family regulator|nr:winged helix-turn-helix transcriptional regulator [Candidatus Peregrinibacteria bacterium]MBT3598346.1 winged helix-turn-helix transcriptional regulator [Candidatus Peregrinibacteria bacterium]MBT4367729.1 winged helix-turn-helix transcriptional regulator [Candidatus Peregrinibacteria bacterium]MBT4585706.1 winged helix-turn-helix transcriptional regulator [Candidatus Peregrinibacteria bacterium]MBT6730540.1 winged helix-turn-helix transcriptional regulator [Candidatus Peregrinibacteria bact